MIKEIGDDPLKVDIVDIGTEYLVQGIRAEFGELRQLSALGQWKADQAVGHIGLSMMGKELSEHAPLFTNLMTELASNSHTTNKRGYVRKEEEGYLVMLASILLLKSSSKTGNRFARMLGYYLQDAGIRRRAIEVLDGLGVTETYSTLRTSKTAQSTLTEQIMRDMARHDDITIVYDNFNYVQKVRHRTTAVYRKMYHYTTAKLVRRGNLIPEGGLLQSMLNRELPIRFMHDIAMSSDFKVSDTWISIQKRCIFNAINAAHPSAVAKIYSGAEDRRPSMPQLDILPCTPTKHLTMGPILENGATDTGTYRVLENIFAKQLGLDEQSAIRGRLYPIYGNQETCTLIRQCQRMMEMEIEEGSQPIYWLRCVLPVTGFWNLRQNYLNVVQKTFWGPENYNGQFSTLYAHMHHLNRPDIPNDGAPVHDLEELVLFSFDARIVAMLYAKIGDKCDVKSSEKIDAYLSSLDVEGFHNVIDSIHAELFASDVRRRCSTVYRETAEGSVTAVDIEAVNTIRYLQVVEVYVVLKYAIKHGDLGLLRICITKCLLTFHGMSSLKYAREVLHLYRLVSTEAAAPELRRALLGCGLVNLRGQPDSFFETDRLVELQNLQIKELMRNRGSSSADISHVFKSCLSTANYHLPLRAEFELAFGERTESGELPNVDESTNLEESPNPNESDSEDPAESRAFDLHSLGELLSQDVLEDKQRTIHHVQFAAPDMIHLGQVRIAEGPSIDRVNEELNGCPWGFDEEEDEETEEEYGRGVKTDHMTAEELREFSGSS